MLWIVVPPDAGVIVNTVAPGPVEDVAGGTQLAVMVSLKVQEVQHQNCQPQIISGVFSTTGPGPVVRTGPLTVKLVWPFNVTFVEMLRLSVSSIVKSLTVNSS